MSWNPPTIHVRTRVPGTKSVKLAWSRSTYPTLAAVRAESPVDVVDQDTGRVDIPLLEGGEPAEFAVGDIVFLGVLPYELTGGGGKEGALFPAVHVRIRDLLAVDFTLDMSVVYEAATQSQKWQYTFNLRPASKLVKSVHLGVFTFGMDYDLPVPGEPTQVVFNTRGLLTWSNYVAICEGYDALGGAAGSGEVGPRAREWIGNVGTRGNLGIKAADEQAPSTVTIADKLILAKGVRMVTDSDGRPRAELNYTISTSDPSGTPDDGELWFKVSP